MVAEEHADGTTEIRGEIDGTPVSRTFIFPMLVRIGEAVVRMDGIGGVATDEAHRHRGYSRRVLKTAVDTMRAGDAALSTLYGIPDFYHRFGFATSGAEHTVKLPASGKAAPRASLPVGWSFRPFTPDNLTAVAVIYDATTARATGAVPRLVDGGVDAPNGVHASNPAAITMCRRAWRDLLKPASADDCRVLIDASGTVVAYAWIGSDTWWIRKRQRDASTSFHIGEAMAIDPQAADALVAACHDWAHESMSGVEAVEFVIPPEGPVAHAAAYEGAAFVQRHTRHGEFMARVLDLNRLFQQMLPELNARLQHSGDAYQGQLTLHTDEGSISLAIRNRGISIASRSARRAVAIKLPQASLASMVLGAFEVSDLAARLLDPPDKQAVEVLATLFPRRAPHIYPADRF
jgi:predicted acetyltransferase